MSDYPLHIPSSYNSQKVGLFGPTVMSPDSVKSAAAATHRIASWVGDHKRDAKRAGLGEERQYNVQYESYHTSADAYER